VKGVISLNTLRHKYPKAFLIKPLMLSLFADKLVSQNILNSSEVCQFKLIQPNDICKPSLSFCFLSFFWALISFSYFLSWALFYLGYLPEFSLCTVIVASLLLLLLLSESVFVIVRVQKAHWLIPVLCLPAQASACTRPATRT